MNAVVTKVSPQNQSVDVCTLSSKMPNKGISLSIDQIKFFSRSFQQGQGISKQSIQVSSVFLDFRVDCRIFNQIHRLVPLMLLW